MSVEHPANPKWSDGEDKGRSGIRVKHGGSCISAVRYGSDDILGRVCKFRVLSRSQKTRFIRVEKDGGVHCLSHGRCGFEEGTVAESVCGSR